MAFTDSMFRFEIVVQELTSYINCREFNIRGQFADVFDVHLEDPNKIEYVRPKEPGKRIKKKKTKRKSSTKISKSPEISSMAPTVQSGQTILFAINVATLVSNMKQYPLELSLWSKVVPDCKIGSTQIPWSAQYFEYLNNLHRKYEQQLICVMGDYNVFDEITSKRMAVIKLNVKLRHFRDRITTRVSSISPETQKTITSSGSTLCSKPTSVVSTISKDRPINVTEGTGFIKTTYSGDKSHIRSKRTNSKRKYKSVDDLSNRHVSQLQSAEVDNKIYKRKFESGIISLVRSDTKLDAYGTVAVIKSKSYSSVDQRNSDILNDSIFRATPVGLFGNQVFFINYFTVENDFADSPKSPKSPSTPKSPKSPKSLSSTKTPTSPKPASSPTSPKPARSTTSPKPASSPTSPKPASSTTSPKPASSTTSPKPASSPTTPKPASSPTSAKPASSPTSPKHTNSPKAVKSITEQLISEKSTSDSEKSISDKLVPEKPKSDSSSITAAERAKLHEAQENERYEFRICESECPLRKYKKKTRGTQSTCSLDLPKQTSHLISVKKCHDVKCTYEKMRELPTPPDDRNMLNLSTRAGEECCKVSQKVEEVITGTTAKMKFGSEPCFCECECQFRFMKKTTFCKVCGGYERFGEDNGDKPGYELPFPCPIYHKLAEKSMTNLTTSGSDTRTKKDSKQKVSPESEKQTNKGKKKTDSRFKFNYGYTAPHIGHSRCALPCVGTLGAVPKRMGWLWTCENVPGMKYRPQWKPGASNKRVVRLLKMAKNPGDFFAKKRKKVQGKPKRPLKRPLLTVQKKEGEFTVTMETMKTFTKPRTFNQYPYENKPLVTYTIGRTSEENLQRKIKKDRARRRLERLQHDFVQSAFSDMCKEICLKTYQQALGLLPNAEKPDCFCFPAAPGSDDVDLDHSCSCCEDKDLSESDTNSDEWMIEFTPPNATFDPTYKSKKVTYTDNTTQYMYTDYRVKLLDRYGNPVPRFFKGPDGKQQCSDLGGFWDPDHNWLEINVDGFIGPDERWAPHIFLGPNNETVDGESGKFQAMDGKWLVIGVDGYVDQGKWKFYPKSKSSDAKKKRPSRKTISAGGSRKKDDKRSETIWNCFGSVSPKLLSRMGIVGHGHDKKLLNTRLRDLLAQGEDIKIPTPLTVPRSNRPRNKRYTSPRCTFTERTQCKHAKPSDRGIVAVDGHGNKTYFRLRAYDNRRPKDRMTTLTDQGISLSLFHAPCFSSFISTEVMKKQQYDRLVAMAERRKQNASQGSTAERSTTVSTPADYIAVST